MPSLKHQLIAKLKSIRDTARYVAQWRTALPVLEYQGRLRETEDSVCYICVGSSQLLTEAIFTEEPSRRQLGEVSAWAAPAYIRRLLKQRAHTGEAMVDMLMMPQLPWHKLSKDELLLPDYLEARIPFHANYAAWLQTLRDNTRRSVQQAQKLGVQFRRASRLEDYRYFHQHLLTPYMQARHGYNCYVEPLAEFCADTRHAVLELLELNGEIVGGFHLKMPAHASSTYFNKVGLSLTSFNNKTQMRLLNSLIYARMAELSLASGYTAMELGITPAILGHGILWYKAGWGAEFRANQNRQRFRLVFCSQRAGLIQAALPALITVTPTAKLMALAWYPASTDAAAKNHKSAELHKYHFTGLSEIQLKPTAE